MCVEGNVLADTAVLDHELEFAAVDFFRGYAVDGTRPRQALAVIREPFFLEPVLYLEEVGVFQAVPREVQVASIASLTVGVDDAEEVDDRLGGDQEMLFFFLYHNVEFRLRGRWKRVFTRPIEEDVAFLHCQGRNKSLLCADFDSRKQTCKVYHWAPNG